MSVTNILPVSEIINVTIENTPQGLAIPNVNNVVLFSNEVPVNPATYGAFQEYISPAQVATDWGTNSVTAAMANALFSQNPNILTGDGQLIIIPLLSAVSATEGNFVTPNISANIANFAAVTNGDLAVTVNGNAYDLANLNFSGVTTLAQIAQIIDNALPAGISVTANATVLTFLSDKVGAISTVALATYAGSGTDLTGVTLLHTATGTATGGANSSGETIAAAITRTSGLVFYCGVMTNLNLEDAAIEDASGAIQALDMLFFPHFTSLADIAGAITAIQQATETKTRSMLYTPSQALANLMKSAYVGRGFSIDFTGNNTALTMAMKSLATINPDTGINQTNYTAAGVVGADIYVSISGVPCVISSGGNDFFDNQYSNLALKFALQTAAFNYLRQTNTKIPQTEPGMNGLKAALALVMDQFVNNGVLAPGAWNSPETFGDPKTFLNNITQKGYYIFSFPVAQQSAAQRNARVAPLIQIAAKRAGAIQQANIIVVINN